MITLSLDDIVNALFLISFAFKIVRYIIRHKEKVSRLLQQMAYRFED